MDLGLSLGIMVSANHAVSNQTVVTTLPSHTITGAIQPSGALPMPGMTFWIAVAIIIVLLALLFVLVRLRLISKREPKK